MELEKNEMEIAWIWKVGQVKNILAHTSHISEEKNEMGKKKRKKKTGKNQTTHNQNPEAI